MRTCLEILLIAVASFVVALGVNALRDNGLSLSTAYQVQEPVLPELTTDIPTVDLDTLKALLQGDMVMLVDARDDAEFLAGHIPGARSLPLNRKESAYDELRDELVSGRTVVTYCVDPGCLDSTYLAAWLLEMGVGDVMVYPGGIKGWQAGDQPVERNRGGLK